MADPEFRSPAEFSEVLDRVFQMLSEDPQMGPALRDADAAQRFQITDLDLVVNIAPGPDGGPNLQWRWSDDVAWEPRTELTMSSPVANQFFQGRLNVPMAIARRRVKVGGDMKLALTLVPITRPLAPRCREMMAAEYPHLAL